MLGAATWTDGPNDTFDVPITVADLNIDLAIAVVGSEKRSGCLALTLPALHPVSLSRGWAASQLPGAHRRHPFLNARK
jgi:hypothetical protein